MSLLAQNTHAGMVTELHTDAPSDVGLLQCSDLCVLTAVTLVQSLCVGHVNTHGPCVFCPVSHYTRVVICINIRQLSLVAIVFSKTLCFRFKIS